MAEEEEDTPVEEGLVMPAMPSLVSAGVELRGGGGGMGGPDEPSPSSSVGEVSN